MPTPLGFGSDAAPAPGSAGGRMCRARGRALAEGLPFRAGANITILLGP